MKKLIILLILTIPIISFAQENITWEYPVKPGTNEWENLDAYQDKLNAYNIPTNILKKISTSELVKTCLKYPELRLIFTRNDIQSGYSYIRSKFNGFRELETREDAGQELLRTYKSYNPDNFSKNASHLEIGRFIVKFTYIELLMAQTEILKKFNSTDINELLKLSTKNYKIKKNLKQYYGPMGLNTNVLLMGRFFNSDLSELRKDFGDHKVNLFIDYGIITDQEIFDKIVSVCEKKLTNAKL
ncbi:MAG: hypothetical protein HQ541_20545 [Mariniphaga sp.]|nr:hypothetical protein [Mariniphaga sp.]